MCTHGTHLLVWHYLYFVRSFCKFTVDLQLHFILIDVMLIITLQDRNRLHNIVKVCSKVTGLPARHLSTVYQQQASGLARCILSDSTHALFPAFERLPSGRRFRCPACKTQRRRATYVPNAILLLNSIGHNNLRCAILQ